MSYQKIILIGNVGADAESKSIASGSITKFSVATSETYVDANGQSKKTVTWHNVVTFGKLADICAKYVKKGMQIAIDGKINNRQWDKDDGTKGFASDVVAEKVKFLGKPVEPKQSEPEFYFDSDSIPF